MTTAAEKVKQFNDRSYVLTGLPTYLVGATLFQGPCHHYPGDEINIQPSRGETITVYVLISQGNHDSRRTAMSKVLGGWNEVSEGSMDTTAFGTEGFDVFSKTTNEAIHLELSDRCELSIAMQKAPTPAPTTAIGTVTGTHDWTMTTAAEKVKQFNDRSYVLTGLPTYLVGATLFQGPCHHYPGDEINIQPSRGETITVYVLISQGNRFPFRKTAMSR